MFNVYKPTFLYLFIVLHNTDSLSLLAFTNSAMFLVLPYTNDASIRHTVAKNESACEFGCIENGARKTGLEKRGLKNGASPVFYTPIIRK